MGNHHAVVVTAPEETRAERVVSRYAAGGRNMSRADVLKMFSLQMSGEEKIAGLKKNAEDNRNGSVLRYDNGDVPANAKKALFEILSKIDVY